MTFPTLEQLINRVWPRDNNRNVNVVLDEHEQHYGLNLTPSDILTQIGQQ